MFMYIYICFMVPAENNIQSKRGGNVAQPRNTHLCLLIISPVMTTLTYDLVGSKSSFL